MGSKKDPGKFTVRFNTADPQQRAAAELLNQQGRCKAQFITNAVLLYVRTVPDGQVPQYAALDRPAEPREQPPAMEPQPVQDGGSLGDTDMDSIRRAMEAFQFSQDNGA